MFIQTETTPNPAVLKFLPGRELMASGTREFHNAEEAAASPLAEALFELGGVTRVFFGQEFLTVTKAPDRDWSHLKAPILAAIMDHFTDGQPLFRGSDAQDGGDILFSKFEPQTGVVWLHMRGACAGCPSSAATLKAGVENMLRHYVPEVTRVEQVL
jgi:hypothetical protein